MNEGSREIRSTGEVWLPVDPAAKPGDASVVFIGRVRSPWSATTPPPKNPGEARERGAKASIEVFEPYRAALEGLQRFSHVIVLAWLHGASRRPLVIRPPHRSEPLGVFALRSPVRPNPIGLSVCRLISLDCYHGLIEVDAIDFLDGTPVLDLKPYRPGIDAVPDAIVG